MVECLIGTTLLLEKTQRSPTRPVSPLDPYWTRAKNTEDPIAPATAFPVNR